jgi:hypothetical protein
MGVIMQNIQRLPSSSINRDKINRVAKMLRLNLSHQLNSIF